MYDVHMQSLIQLNFLPLVAILFLLIFVIVNDAYEHELTVKFRRLLLMLLFLIFFDNLDYYAFDTKLTGIFHVFTAVVGYNLRIFILAGLIMIVTREIRNKFRWLLYLPAIINLAVTFLAFFTRLVFWYDENGQTRRGPLGYTPHVMMLIYLSVCTVMAFRQFRHGNKEEATIILVEVILCILGTYVELIYQLRGILIGVISLNITFYYLYIHICFFRIDPLTGTFNRTSFYADSGKYSGNITAVISIDVNNLKQINDHLGHPAGDEAICSVATSVRNALPSDCRLYRVGGDEFCVICIHQTKARLDKLMQELKQIRERYDNSFAAGMSEWVGSFEKTYFEADQKMYLDKAECKRQEE